MLSRPRPAEAPTGDKPGAPAVPKPGPVAHGPRRPGGYPKRVRRQLRLEPTTHRR